MPSQRKECSLRPDAWVSRGDGHLCLQPEEPFQSLELKPTAVLKKTTPVLILLLSLNVYETLVFFFFLFTPVAEQRLSCETLSGIKVLIEILSLATSHVSVGFI